MLHRPAESTAYRDGTPYAQESGQSQPGTFTFNRIVARDVKMRRLSWWFESLPPTESKYKIAL